MSAKRARSGYKFTPCGEIPQEWDCVPLGDIFAERIETGFNDLPLLAVTGDRGVVPRDSLNRRDSSNEDKSAYLRVLPGDIAYNTMRMWQGVAGLSEHEGIVSPAYTVCRPLKKLLPAFAPYLLKHPANIRLFHRHSQGLVDDTLNLKFHHFAKIHVPLPTVREQRRIGKILEEIDTAIVKACTALAQRRRVRDSVALAQIQSLRGPRVTLGEIISSIDAGKSPQCPDRPARVGEVGVLKLSAVGLNGFVPSENKVVLDSSIFDLSPEIRVGDLLITRANTPELVGLTCVVTSTPVRLFLSDLILRLTLDSSRIDAAFLDLSLKMPLLRRQISNLATGTSDTMRKINRAAIRSLRVTIPPLERQREIVKLTRDLNLALTSEEQKITTLESIKGELARRLLTGELRVKP
jgi:type I restriction enzyme S subunit